MGEDEDEILLQPTAKFVQEKYKNQMFSEKLKGVIQIGPYTLGTKIGTGYTGHVYTALNTEDGSFVAIKRVRRRKDDNEHMIINEAGFLKQLHHRNVLQFF